MKHIPEIRNDNHIPTLYVQDAPYLAFAGEVHNSSGSSLAYMQDYIWPSIKELNLNTLIVPIYWELMEKVEGTYDYTLMDGIIQQARSNQKHLILLWFGLWKNGESMYVPGWMKQDSQKYFRVQTVGGEKLDTISPFCYAAVEKDKNALSHIMSHLKEIDESESTVIAVQVENEIGVLGAERDYCKQANDAFLEKIPALLKEDGMDSLDWKAGFGDNAEDFFMAYYYAKAVNEIAEAGKKEYPIPLYVNAWLEQHPWYPGTYPSGGPIKRVHHIWKKAAPAISVLAPDIYVPYAIDVMDEYHYEDNPLLIPEARKDAVTASYCWYAFMKHHAICYSPFGIEDLGLPSEMVTKPPKEVMAELNINPIMFETDGGKEYLSQVYALLEQIQPLYFKYRGTKQMQTFIKRSDTDLGTAIRFKNYDVLVEYFPAPPGNPIATGTIFELAENQFLMMGMMHRVSFRVKPGENKKIRALKLESGTISNGTWVPQRQLNGDEQMNFNFGPSPTCMLVELYQY